MFFYIHVYVGISSECILPSTVPQSMRSEHLSESLTQKASTGTGCISRAHSQNIARGVNSGSQIMLCLRHVRELYSVRCTLYSLLIECQGLGN